MPFRPGRVLLAAFAALTLVVLLTGTVAASAATLPAASLTEPPALLPVLAAEDTFTATVPLKLQGGPVAVDDSALIALPFIGRNTPPIPITELGTLGGESVARAINARGDVAGAAYTAAGQQHAFLWRNGVMTDINTVAGATSWPVAINDRGQIAGYTTLPGAVPTLRAFAWTDGVMADLGTLGGSNSSAVDINERGQVIGVSTTASGSQHSFVWAGGVMTDLGTLGGDSAYVTDLNDRGQIAGYSRTAGPAGPGGPAGTDHAFLWQNGAMLDIHPPGADSSTAVAINERGQVAGAYTEGQNQFAFVWETGVFTKITPPGVTYIAVDDFNERGQLVAFAGPPSTAPGALRLFLWSEGSITPLNGPGLGPYCPARLNDTGQIVFDSPTGPVLWDDGAISPLALLTPFRMDDLNCPAGLNNRGQIVGSSRTAAGEFRAVLWEAGE